MKKNLEKRPQQITIMPSVAAPDAKASMVIFLPLILEKVDLRNSHQPNNDDTQVHPDYQRNKLGMNTDLMKSIPVDRLATNYELLGR
jgi:hypothetical protein